MSTCLVCCSCYVYLEVLVFACCVLVWFVWLWVSVGGVSRLLGFLVLMCLLLGFGCGVRICF